MGLIHIQYEYQVMWCSHGDAQAWTSDVDEASCADCIKAFLLHEKDAELVRLRTRVEMLERILDHITQGPPEVLEWVRARMKIEGLSEETLTKGSE